ncbi:hypothetical protein LZ554_003631 [Drepanopeziza brunnea f. sp. 'monogermtubi']|nr:hypothetical protein LZ554_003631 [Drepanopeziza brunnea f. sp. 'monogermtubi']
MSPGRVSEDGEKESLVPNNLATPFSDAEEAPHIPQQTTFDSSQKTIAHQRTTIRILASTLIIIILAITTLLYKSLFPSGLNVRHKPLHESFPLVPADFPKDRRWSASSGQDPFRTAWWPNEDDIFAHNGVNATLRPGQGYWRPTQDPEENVWAKYGNPYIMLHKKDPQWLPHGVEFQQNGPEDAWLADYNGFLTVHGHSIHCLGVLRHHLTLAIHSRKEQDPTEMEHANGHCIEVLRRAIECQPNLYMTGIIDSNFWDPKTQNNPNMCRAGVQEWLKERWIPRHVLFKPLSAETREGTRFVEGTDIRDFDRVPTGR